jgi:hypothetical protein
LSIPRFQQKQKGDSIEILRDPGAFVEQAVRGPACLLTQFEAIPQCYDLLVQRIKAKGCSAKDLARLMQRNLRASCLLCQAWTGGATLGTVWSVYQFGRQNTSFTSYGDAAHLVDGRCISPNCHSKEVLLIWIGSQTIEHALATHLARVRSDAEKVGDAATVRCVDQLSNPEILAFTTDACFASGLGYPAAHRYVGRGFVDVPGVCVWVSVLTTGISDTDAFPGGYGYFFQSLLTKSQYPQATQCVAHWIRWEETGVVNLGVVAEYGPKQKVRILPVELMSEQACRKLTIRD